MTKEQFVVACIGQLTSAKTTDDLDRLRLAFGGLAEMFEGGTPDAALKFNRIGAVDYAKMGSSMRLLQQATVTLSEAQDAPDWRKGVLKNKAESELLSARAVVHEETASEAKQFEDKVKTFHDEVTRESRTGRTK